MNKLSIDDIDLKGRRVLTRVEFNVPLDENLAITDDNRIVEALPTIKKISGSGGRLILMAHLGRPKGKPEAAMSLRPCAVRLSEILGAPVSFADDCVGPKADDAVRALKDGEVLLLENLRFHPGETENDPSFSAALSKHGDVFVNDAFGASHRAHASIVGAAKHFETRVGGYLMKKELDYFGRALSNPEKPFVAIIGGAKISGKIDVIEHLKSKVDYVLVGGGMAATFYKALGYEIGDSLYEEDRVEMAGSILEKFKNAAANLVLPVDCLVADAFENNATTKEVEATAIEPGWRVLDIGPRSVAAFSKIIATAKTVVWNGPMGVFEMEKFAGGTHSIAESLVRATEDRSAVTIIGGGDSAAAIKQLGYSERVSHVSTGGGASLEFLEGKVLPGVDILTNKPARKN